MAVNRIVVLGSGGHGRVVADAILKMKAAGEPVELAGFLDDDPGQWGKTILGAPVSGPINRDSLAAIEHDNVIIGIGSNWLRFNLATLLREWGETPITVTHPSSVVGTGVEIGVGTIVGPGAVVNVGSTIGNHVILNTSSSVDHDNRVDDYAHLCPGVRLGGDVHIGEGVMCGIGANILPQTRIGNWSVIGSGSTVLRSVRGFEVRVGAPSRRTRSMVQDLTGDLDTWHKVLARHPHDVYHLPEYLQTCAREEQSREMALHVAIEDSELFLPLLVKQVPRALGLRDYWDATTPYGFPAPLIQAGSGDRLRVLFDGLRLACQELRIASLFIRLHPLLGDAVQRLEEHGQLVYHGPTVHVDLLENDEDHWSQTRTRHRRSLQKLANEGFVFRMDQWEHYPEFCDIYTATMGRLGASRYYFFSSDYFTDLRRGLGNKLHLATVMSPDGRVAAGGLFTEVDGLVQYHLGGTSVDFIDRAPSKLMIHGAREWFKGRGARVLNLGGGLGGAQDELFLFKSGFSRHTAEFWTFRLETDTDACRELNQRHRKLLKDRVVPGGYFPPYRFDLG